MAFGLGRVKSAAGPVGTLVQPKDGQNGVSYVSSHATERGEAEMLVERLRLHTIEP